MTRVLVIDDHTPSRMHLSRILPQCGYEIAEAASGKSAVVCACIERAKGMLMEHRKLSEEQAYSLIKKASMNMRKPMADVAQAILLAGGLLNDKNG